MIISEGYFESALIDAVVQKYLNLYQECMFSFCSVHAYGNE